MFKNMAVFQKEETFEQKHDRKVRFEVDKQAQEIRQAECALGWFVKPGVTHRQMDLQNEIYRVLTAPKPSTPAVKGFQVGTRSFEYGKMYQSAGTGILYTVWNPANLSKKQQSVIHNFIIELTDGLPDETLTFEKVAPWIDVVFMFNRGDITQAAFNAITGLRIKTSTFDARNDHNL